MSDINYSIRESEAFTLDFSIPFCEAIKDMRSEKGGKMRSTSHVYHVFAALFNGHVIDDYANPPRDYDDRVIRNVVQRVGELRDKWNIDVQSRKVEGKPYNEYYLDRSFGGE